MLPLIVHLFSVLSKKEKNRCATDDKYQQHHCGNEVNFGNFGTGHV